MAGQSDSSIGPIESRDAIIDVLRGRVLRGLQAGTLQPGDRLASARDLAGEFGVDYRAVIAAYKGLAAEGLVELRPRGGVYVAAHPLADVGRPPLPEGWFAETLTQALAREIPGPALPRMAAPRHRDAAAARGRDRVDPGSGGGTPSRAPR